MSVTFALVVVTISFWWLTSFSEIILDHDGADHEDIADAADG